MSGTAPAILQTGLLHYSPHVSPAQPTPALAGVDWQVPEGLLPLKQPLLACALGSNPPSPPNQMALSSGQFAPRRSQGAFGNVWRYLVVMS